MEFGDLAVSHAANDAGTHVKRSALTRRSSMLNDKDVIVACTHDLDVGRDSPVGKAVNVGEVGTDLLDASEDSRSYVASRIDPHNVRRERRRWAITFLQIGIGPM
jgi:hypothetical protein